MSTIQSHLDSGELRPFNPNLRADQQRCRLLYFSQRAADWAKETLTAARTDDYVPGSASPRDQLGTLARRYCAGEEMRPPLPHQMRPVRHGVWRLRTPDLRIVGWFPERYRFIISEIELKQNCTNERDNELLLNACQYRDMLDINGGNFLEGKIDDCI